MQHQIVNREQWRAARLDLLEEEKELTRRSDELAKRRQQLPWVRIDKAYRFETDQGSASMADLFGGRSQLLVYHFMFGPDYTAGCPSCSAIADGFDGSTVHLANHDVALWAVSRAPLEKLQAFKRRMGWAFPWASSLGSDFNFDFEVSFTEQQQRAGGIEYNYRREPAAAEPLAGKTVQEWQAPGDEGPVAQIAATTGTDVATYTRERPGIRRLCARTGRSITPIPPMRADWMASGACTSGLIARRRGATRPVSGGAVTTSMAKAEPPTAGLPAMKVVVHPLTLARWDDLEAVFNAKGCSIARGCWCMYDRVSGKGPLTVPDRTTQCQSVQPCRAMCRPSRDRADVEPCQVHRADCQGSVVIERFVRWRIGVKWLALCIAALAAQTAAAQTSSADNPAGIDWQPLDGFAIARTETSVAQYRRHAQSLGITTRAERAGGGEVFEAGWTHKPGWTWRSPFGRPAADDEPAVHLSFDEARNFCHWAGGRLPRDAEWLSAAHTEQRTTPSSPYERGRTYPYPTGESPQGAICLGDCGPQAGALAVAHGAQLTRGAGHAAVGRSKPGVNGLFDMGANVWEWVDDPPDTDAPRRTRGGSWWYGAEQMRASHLQSKPADTAVVYIGFRCVR